MTLQIKNYLNRTLDIPLDTITDYPIIQIMGNSEINIENHKGILEFHTDNLKLSSKLGDIIITGNSLQIRVINQHDIIVTGKIISVQYSAWGGGNEYCFKNLFRKLYNRRSKMY